jgi:hypothetical protein
MAFCLEWLNVFYYPKLASVTQRFRAYQNQFLVDTQFYSNFMKHVKQIG